MENYKYILYKNVVYMSRCLYANTKSQLQYKCSCFKITTYNTP